MFRTLPIACVLLLLLAALPAFSASNDWQSAIRVGDHAAGSATSAISGMSAVMDTVAVGTSIGAYASRSEGVPEPGGLLAFATGLIGLVGLMMRRAPRLRS